MKRAFLPKGMSKKAVKAFFAKVDGSVVGTTGNSQSCPLHAFLVKELGYDPYQVDVQTNRIIIDKKVYNTDEAWPNVFVLSIDEYGHRKNMEDAEKGFSINGTYSRYDYSRKVTGDECLAILEEI